MNIIIMKLKNKNDFIKFILRLYNGRNNLYKNYETNRRFN